MKITELILAFLIVIGSAAAGHADVNTDLNNQTSQMNALATSQGTSKTVDKISAEFSDFLGTDSKAVVTGLRNGTPITLTRTVSTPTTVTSAPPANTTPTTTTTTTINPPTGKMGFGNVFISLALAKQQLGQLGITQPTPEQLKAALVGGSFTTGTGTTTATGTTTGTATATNTTKLEGILTMRSQNMGWGQIAQKLGFKLGPVVSGLKSANHSMTTAATSSPDQGSVAAGNQPNTASKSGIVSGSGKVHGASGHETSGKTTSGEGIVTAAGRSINNGNAYGYGKGIVTGSGHAAGGTNGATTSGGPGNSSGHGNGYNK